MKHYKYATKVLSSLDLCSVYSDIFINMHSVCLLCINSMQYISLFYIKALIDFYLFERISSKMIISTWEYFKFIEELKYFGKR